MLGIGRASEYAGWWNGNAPASFVSASSATMTALGKFPGATSVILANSSWNSPDNDGSNAIPFSFDSTGLINSPNFVVAMTYQVANSSTYTFSSGTGINYMKNSNGDFVGIVGPTYNYPGGQFWNPGLSLGLGNGVGNGTTNLTGFIGTTGFAKFAFPVQWNNYTNQFLTIVMCGSTTSATFSGYSHNTALYGSAPTGSNLLYCRAVLANATTGAVIATNDQTLTYGTPVDFAD